MSKHYYAKSVSNGATVEVREHLSKVSKLAAEFGVPLNLEKTAGIAGMLHDFGKYSDFFQDVLKGTRHGCDHAGSGAAMLYAQFKKKTSWRPIMEAIAGHHDGLLEFEQLRMYLEESLTSEENCISPFGKAFALSGREAYKNAMLQFNVDFPGYQLPDIRSEALSAGTILERMLYTRMLFSCLVDADYSISAMDVEPEYLERTAGIHLNAAEKLQALYTYRDGIRRRSTAQSELNQMRDALFEACGEAGDQTEGLFTLTAPTGTGKTLALLHFALRHCIAANKQRIIVVLPFLTLAEQNAAIYESIVSDVLIDHSQSNLGDDAREVAARWSHPFIITTSVRFFESLFSRKPGDCRKLHHIANSVVLFDEAQSLPLGVMASTLQAVRALCLRYHCTMVFSSATQPTYAAIPGIKWQPREIMPEHERMYAALRRTRVEWRLNPSDGTTFEQIAWEMAAEKGSCAIVNLRKHARELYGLVKALAPDRQVFYLTTDLCPAHRSAVVAQVTAHLQEGAPCSVVATQCIEAGVDLDFDVLYRALAPLDSIIQSAGRCNRNGRLAEGGRVVVFEPDAPGRLYPDLNYDHFAKTVKRIAMDRGIDIHDPAQIQAYYAKIFRNHADKPALTEALEAGSFEAVQQEYKLIPNQGVRIIVPYDAELYADVVSQARAQGLSAALMHLSAPITVTAYPCANLELYAENLPYKNRRGAPDVGSNYYILRPQYEDLYTQELGLQFPENDAGTMANIW